MYYFFFRIGSPRADLSLEAYRSILAQMLHTHREDPSVVDRFNFAIFKSRLGQEKASRKELIELFRLCSYGQHQHFIILDGIDECADNAQFVQDLREMGLSLRTKIIMFSRHNVRGLRDHIPETQQLAIQRSNAADIELYLQRRLSNFVDQETIPQDPSVSGLAAHLSIGADGMFLWARLMIDYLASDALTPQQRVDTILEVSMPEGLDKMYDRIALSISRGNRVEKRLAKWVITWLAFANRPLTAVELKESLTVMTEEIREQTDTLKDFDRSIVMICASLIEKSSCHDSRYDSPVPCYRFVHQSVREYFHSFSDESAENTDFDRNTHNVLEITSLGAHVTILAACLRYLVYCMPAQEIECDGASSSPAHQMDKTFPLSSYSVLRWINHLTQTGKECYVAGSPSQLSTFRSLFLSLARFLRHESAIRSWIQACYTFGQEPSGLLRAGMGKWINKARGFQAEGRQLDFDMGTVVADVEEFVNFLPELERDWGTKLFQNPAGIWTWAEITSFTPCRLLRLDPATTIRSLQKDTPEFSENSLSTNYLSKISQETADGQTVGVLSVWTSRYGLRYSYCDYRPRYKLTVFQGITRYCKKSRRRISRCYLPWKTFEVGWLGTKSGP